MTAWEFLSSERAHAGSVLGNRWSASGKRRVLMLEAGLDLIPGKEPSDIRNVFPLSSFNDTYMWPDTFVHWRSRETSSRVVLPQGASWEGALRLWARGPCATIQVGMTNGPNSARTGGDRTM